MINIDLSAMVANSNSPLYDPSYPTGNRPLIGTAWKVASTYKVGQKLPLKVVYPRPDNETAVHAIHRKASSHWAYEMRIAIQGGEAPFRFDIISGPSGSTITNEFTRTIDSGTGLTLHSIPTAYSTVVWPNPTGTASWVIRVTDQSDAYVDVIWSTATDETAFVVLDSTSGVDSNAGTWTAPIRTFSAGLWKSSEFNTTFANKIAAFKTGTYSVYQTNPGESVGLDLNVKPCALMGIPGSTVVLDTSQGHFYVNRGDIAVVNMEVRGSRTTDENTRIFQVSSKNSNYLFWKLKFTNQVVGTLAGDNPASIVFMDHPTTITYYIAVCECTLDSTSAMQILCTFATDGVVVENCDFNNVDLSVYNNGAQFIHLKDDSRNVSVRFNRLSGEAANGLIVFSNQQNANHAILAYNQEACYNYVRTTASTPLSWNQAALEADNSANSHCYRNALISPNTAVTGQRWTGGEAVQLSGNAYTATNIGYSQSTPPGWVEVTPINIKVLSTEVDSSGRLTTVNGRRASGLGKIGLEIASTAM